MEKKNFECQKCGNRNCEIGEIRAAGGFWSKIFDLQNRRFVSVTCTKCKFTEFYKGAQNNAGNILDFFTG